MSLESAMLGASFLRCRPGSMTLGEKDPILRALCEPSSDLRDGLHKRDEVCATQGEPTFLAAVTGCRPLALFDPRPPTHLSQPPPHTHAHARAQELQRTHKPFKRVVESVKGFNV